MPASAVAETFACVSAKLIVPAPVDAVIETAVTATAVTLNAPPLLDVPTMLMSEDGWPAAGTVGISPSMTVPVTVATFVVSATWLTRNLVGDLPSGQPPNKYCGTPSTSNETRGPGTLEYAGISHSSVIESKPHEIRGCVHCLRGRAGDWRHRDRDSPRAPLPVGFD